MRLSADHMSQYFYANALIELGADPDSLIVTLDGMPNNDVLEADDEEGWAVVISRDMYGQIEEGHGGGAATQRIEGANITFAWKPLP